MEIKRVLFIGSKRAGLECVKKMYEIAQDKLIGVITTNDSEDTRSEFNSFIQFSDKVPVVVARSKEDSEVIIQTLKPELCHCLRLVLDFQQGNLTICPLWIHRLPQFPLAYI